MKILLVYIHLLLINASYTQNCEGFKTGTYISENTFGSMIIERKDDFQLERTKDNSTVYFQKTEKISGCEYIVKRYKIIQLGNLPMPDMKEKVKVKIINVEGDNFQYNAELIDTELSIDGVLVKISDDVSDEFKKLIYQEK